MTHQSFWEKQGVEGETLKIPAPLSPHLSQLHTSTFPLADQPFQAQMLCTNIYYRNLIIKLTDLEIQNSLIFFLIFEMTPI
jgi:hypothetical protein